MDGKIYFYYPGSLPAAPDFKSGLDCWILKTYHMLRNLEKAGPIEITDRIHDSGIFIFHRGFFPSGLRPSLKQYFVCVQADYGRYRFAQYHIHQNPNGPRNFRFSKRSFFEDSLFTFVRNHFIPHWNQENIIKRKRERGLVFENICFMGLEKNLPPQFLAPSFSEKLKSMGLSLQVNTDPRLWNDYSHADCVISVRDLNSKPHYNKPSSKVVNSFLAGVPVISGSESSAIYLKEKLNAPVEIVKSEDEFIQAVLKIKSNYRHYLNAVEQTDRSLSSYHDESIGDEWCNTLSEIRQLSGKWLRSGSFARKFFYFYSSL